MRTSDVEERASGFFEEANLEGSQALWRWTRLADEIKLKVLEISP